MDNVAGMAGSENFEGVIRIEEEKIRSHVDEVVRQTVEQTLNGLLEAEADELCGAKRYARSPERLDTRAGHYDRKLQTQAGEVTLQVPRLRNLPFETEIIERYRRRESSVEEALVEMYLAGVSVRRVEDITEALWGTRVSPSTVSELNQKIYTQIEAWRNRPIEGEHAYVYLDGIWLKRSWGGEVKNVAVLVAIGVRSDGYREILGVVEGMKEDTESWRNFLRHLKQRGLRACAVVRQRQVLGLGRSAGRVLSRGGLAALHGALVSQRDERGAQGQGEGSDGDAQSDPCPGRSPGCSRQGRAGGREADGRAAGPGGHDRARRRGRDALVHGFPARALDADPHQQRAGANHA